MRRAATGAAGLPVVVPAIVLTLLGPACASHRPDPLPAPDAAVVSGSPAEVFTGDAPAGNPDRDASVEPPEPDELVAGEWVPIGPPAALMGTLPGDRGAVQDVVVYRGDVVVAGSIRVSADRDPAYIAVWNGSTWRSFDGGADRMVRELFRWGDRLVAGGHFTEIGGIAADHVAIHDGDRWAAMGDGLDGGVETFAVHDGALYAGGEFRFSGDTEMRRIARWDGTRWRPVGSGVGDPGPSADVVHALASHEGTLWVGGAFKTIGDARIRNLAVWNGETWSAGGDTDDAVQTFGHYRGELIVGGKFKTIGGAPLAYIARRSVNGFEPLGAGLSRWAVDVATHRGWLVVGGCFLTAGDVAAEFVAAWNGSRWVRLGSGLDMCAWSVSATDDRLLVGGGFTRAGGAPAQYVATWDPDARRGK